MNFRRTIRKQMGFRVSLGVMLSGVEASRSKPRFNAGM
jgi:hypothetical protein